MKRLEVRCCCDANKVLGHLTHPQLQQPGDRVLFPLLREPREWGEAIDADVPTRTLELTVDEFFEYPVGEFGPGRARVAIKNRDYPLEDLRLIPGFEPATWDPFIQEATDGQEGNENT